MLFMIYVIRTNEHYCEISIAMPKSHIIDVRYKHNPFSPLYSFGNIHIPYSDSDTASSVSAVMNKLKVQENPTCYHRGISSHVILNMEDAKRELLYPTYKWVLDNKLQPQIVELRNIAKIKDIAILDYPKNTKGKYMYTGEISIGYLLKAYLEGSTPYEDVYEYKEEYRYFTNHKHIHGYERLIHRIPREIPSFPCSEENQQLKLPFQENL